MCPQFFRILLWYYILLVKVHCRTTKTLQKYGIVVQNRNYTVHTPKGVDSWTLGQETGRLLLDGKEVVFRVVEGELADLGEVPYQASFRKRIRRSKVYASFCGGTIIAERKIISAAHCFHHKSIWDSCCTSGSARPSQLESMLAVAGVTDTFVYYHQEDTNTYGQWRKISSAIYPKSYSFPDHDICVVTVTKPFHFGNHVNSVNYAVKTMDYSGTCLVSGFGRIGAKQVSKHLRKADLRVLTENQCVRIHGKDMHRYICTADDVSDIGKGDSGGPLVCKNTGDPNDKDNRGVLVGIVCGKRLTIKHGSFFIRVSTYINFLLESMDSSSQQLRYSTTLKICLLILFL